MPENSGTQAMIKKLLWKIKPGKTFCAALIVLLVAFIASSSSLILSYVLKHAVPSEYGIIKGNKEDLELTYKEILFFATIVTAFFLISLSLKYIRKKWVRLSLITFSLVYLVAASLIILIDCVYYTIFSYRLTFSVVQTVLNTNVEEIKGFARLYTSFGNIAAIVIYIAVIIILIRKREQLIVLFSTGPFFLLSSVGTVFGVIDFAQTAHSKGNGPHNVRYWDIVIGEYNEYNEFNRRLEAEKNTQLLSKEYELFHRLDTMPKTMVFVVSESLSKRHMSLYGYRRNTTPRLDSNKDILKFENCVTHAALTIDAVPGLFCHGYLSKKINLISLLNKLNYETTWISNQSGWGKGDRSIVLLSQICSRSVFMDAMLDDGKSNGSIHFDGEVLHDFEKIINAPSKRSKFIVLHLMGCHFDYEKRYPADWNFFNSPSPAKTAVNNERSQKVLNLYDNAMRYHDSVVNALVDIFTRYSADKNAALVFLSDHGEELYENRDYAGHGYPPSKYMSEIPYFTVVSTGFRKNYPGIVRTMDQRTHTPYISGNNFFTLLHLLNISSYKYRDKILAKAFFSPYYDSIAPRLVMGMDYDNMDF